MTSEAALRDLLQQTERSGTRRRAVMLHADRLAKPHHLRLAREALAVLTQADRAQLFELPQNRTAIVWRSRGGDELARARAALDHLLTGGSEEQAPTQGEVLTVYDLPEQAAWLLDEICQPDGAAAEPAEQRTLDARQLACLEASLGQADLTRFVRWHPVMRLQSASPALAWEERCFSIVELAASLCPGVALKSDPWLFRRLTRALDRRMLAILTSPRELRGCGSFAIHMNVETILSPDFLRFDEALPLAMRGEVILTLHAADILADPGTYTFARRFAQARGYRLALARASLALLRFLDVQAAGLDFIHLPCSAELMRSPGALRERSGIVLGGLDDPASLAWAVRQGFEFGQGNAAGG